MARVSAEGDEMTVRIEPASLMEATIVQLADALYTTLNLEGVAIDGNEMGSNDLDVPYHFAKVRAALQMLAERYPDLDDEARS